jgi:NAD(P)-dependent dehydrogenase (short-subunit alcohol dehydrogenase family)
VDLPVDVKEHWVSGICERRVVIITGAGRGIGREHALEFARQGARVVVNDLGAAVDGVDGNGAGVARSEPAEEVAAEIRAMGGEAVASGDDVSDWDGAERLVKAALGEFGTLDVLVNNAGILRDRMLFSMGIDEWDAVIRVHLRGTFAPLRHAAAYWREQSKAGHAVDARIINTSSGSGLYGNAGQGNYGTAKAGIAGLTIIASRELGRYGVTVNAVAPAAMTRMTESLPHYAAEKERMEHDAGAFHELAPDNIAPLVVWLGSAESAGVTGRVFNVFGGLIGVAEGWDYGPAVDKGARWDPAELGEVVPALLAQAKPVPDVHRPRAVEK